MESAFQLLIKPERNIPVFAWVRSGLIANNQPSYVQLRIRQLRCWLSCYSCELLVGLYQMLV